MPTIHENKNRTKLWYPVRLSCKFTVDSDLVKRCQSAGDRPHKGTPIGKMLELWPFDMLKHRALDEAKLFLHYMRLQGYEPLQAETGLLLYGPYMEKLDWSKVGAEWLPEKGNHTILDKRKAVPAWGYRIDELRDDKGLTFLIWGRFIAHYGHQSDDTGVLIV